MEQKNNKGLIALVVVLIIMVLGLGGYIVYDKVLVDNTVENSNNLDNANNINNDSGTNLYSLSDLVGTYKFEATNEEPCGEIASYELRLYSNSTFQLDYPGACAGQHGTKGTFELENDNLKLVPTHFVDYGNWDNGSPLTGDLIEWKNVSVNIVDKNTLNLTTHNQSQYNHDLIILKK